MTKNDKKMTKQNDRQNWDDKNNYKQNDKKMTK